MLVQACDLHNGFHGMTGRNRAGAVVCIDTAYAGTNWSPDSTVRDAQGDVFYPLTLAWHEYAHVLGLPDLPQGVGATSCPNLAGKTVLFRELSDDGAPGNFGSADLAVLNRIYGSYGITLHRSAAGPASQFPEPVPAPAAEPSPSQKHR